LAWNPEEGKEELWENGEQWEEQTRTERHSYRGDHSHFFYFPIFLGSVSHSLRFLPFWFCLVRLRGEGKSPFDSNMFSWKAS
jgi:hypothetical protein